MIVARDTPLVAHIVEHIGATVAIHVLQAGYFIARGGIEALVLGIVGDAEHLVHSGGEEFVRHPRSIIVAGAAHDPDLSATRAKDESAVGHEVDGANFGVANVVIL